MAALLTYLLLCLIWGSTWLGIRIGLADMPPFWFLAIRLVIAFVALAVLALQRKSDFSLLRRRAGLVLVIGLFTHPISYSLVYWGEQHVTSGMAAVVFSCMPFFVAIFSWWLLPGERVTPWAMLGLLLGFGGLAVIYSDQLVISGTQTVLGMAAISTSGLIAAGTTVSIRRWLSGAPAISLAACTVTVGAVVMPVAAFATEPFAQVHFTASAVTAALYLGIFGSGVAFVLYYRLLSRLPALTMSLITFITPLVALILAAVFESEAHTRRSFVGTVMVLAGVLLATLRVRKASPGTRTR
jgi:drug/metabolite transporter (DMT)-like permease